MPSACLTLLLFATLFSGGQGSGARGQTKTDQARIVERLPNGEAIIEIDGVELRAITADRAREIVARKAELERVKTENALLIEQNARLKDALVLAKKDAELAGLQSQLANERASKFQLMYDGEHALRLQCETLARGNSVTRFFNNPYVQIGFKIVWPAVEKWIDWR